MILFFIILRIKSQFYLFFLSPVTQWLHISCLHQIPSESQWNSIYAALVCGENLPEGDTKKLFIATGIIHLMVISGAHLIFIEKAWSLLPVFRYKQIILGIFLSLYAMSSGLKPPIVRALFSLILHGCNKKFKLFCSPYWRVQISGMLCLIYHTAWVHSMSLQLSWLASIGMANRFFSRLTSCTLTYLLILPIVSQWGGIHPFSILINWLLAPIASAVLLPLSMLIIPIPAIHSLVDICWSQFIQLLNWFRPLMENQGIQTISFSSFYIWIYIWVLFILFQISFVYLRQIK